MTARAMAECDGATVVSGGDPAQILRAANHDLDGATTPVAALFVSDWFVRQPVARDARLDALGAENVRKPVGTNGATLRVSAGLTCAPLPSLMSLCNWALARPAPARLNWKSRRALRPFWPRHAAF